MSSMRIESNVDSILSRARSTLSHSKQFRASDIGKAKTVSAPPPSRANIPAGPSANGIANLSAKSSRNSVLEVGTIKQGKEKPAPGDGVLENVKLSVKPTAYADILTNSPANKKGTGRSQFNILQYSGTTKAPAAVTTSPVPTTLDKTVAPSATHQKKVSKQQAKAKTSGGVKFLPGPLHGPRKDHYNARKGQRGQAVSEDSSLSESDDSSEEDEKSGSKTMSTITPPTMTETSKSTKTKSRTVSTSNRLRRMSKDATSPDTETGGDGIKPRAQIAKTKIEIQKPTDPLSKESRAAIKWRAMNQQLESKSKSYTDDFDSEIQSVAEEFSKSKSFARSTSTSVEIPMSQSDSVGQPLPSSKSLSGSRKTSANSYKIMNEIKENVQRLAITASEAPGTTGGRGSFSDDEKTLQSESESQKKSFQSLSQSRTSSNAKSFSNISKLGSKSAVSKPSTISNNNSSSRHSKLSYTTGSKTIQKRSEVLPLSRSTSRKVFQAKLSQADLLDGDDPSQNILAVPSLEKIFRKKTSMSKAQCNIQSILEREVYKKELHRLRKMQEREEKELQKLHEMKTKNFIAVQERNYPTPTDKQGRNKFQQPIPPSKKVENWGAPYFNADGSLGEGCKVDEKPRTPIQEFAAQVQGMGVPQLVQAVVDSNHRMYKMTVKAAKDMNKAYGRDLRLGRKMKETRDKQKSKMKSYY